MNKKTLVVTLAVAFVLALPIGAQEHWHALRPTNVEFDPGASHDSVTAFPTIYWEYGNDGVAIQVGFYANFEFDEGFFTVHKNGDFGDFSEQEIVVDKLVDERVPTWARSINQTNRLREYRKTTLFLEEPGIYQFDYFFMESTVGQPAGPIVFATFKREFPEFHFDGRICRMGKRLGLNLDVFGLVELPDTIDFLVLQLENGEDRAYHNLEFKKGGSEKFRWVTLLWPRRFHMWWHRVRVVRASMVINGVEVTLENPVWPHETLLPCTKG